MYRKVTSGMICRECNLFPTKGNLQLFGGMLDQWGYERNLNSAISMSSMVSASLNLFMRCHSLSTGLLAIHLVSQSVVSRGEVQVIDSLLSALSSLARSMQPSVTTSAYLHLMRSSGRAFTIRGIPQENHFLISMIVSSSDTA